MQIVIDVPNIDYEAIMLDKQYDARRLTHYERVIANGTPLPKGHGRLIDADELKKIIQENDVLNMRGFNVRLCDINNTPTIIEADKAESEEV